MKKMQRVFALILAASMFIAVLAGCSGGDPDDRGAIIYMYLGADPSNINLDPAKMLFSSEAVKFIGLMFEGLTVMDDRGRLEKGMAKNWTIIEDEERDIYKMHFELYDTKWSDGIIVSADDFVYAWKRILEPDFHSPAAPLLFDIKNARAVKEGEMTVDDLGIAALDLTLLEVTFERKIDYERFLENVASIALVPVRADTVDYEPETWAMSAGDPISLTLLSNGPFSIKQLEYNRSAMFERSIYYRLEGKRGENIMKFVRPYRIVLDFSRPLEAITTAFGADNIDDQVFFLGSVPTSRFEEFRSRAETRDMLSAYSIHFNANRAPFNRPEVRQALSVALDRNHIASLAGLGVSPATGMIPAGIVGSNPTGADFRSENGELIAPGGDRAKAQSLLSSAGVSGGSIELKVRNDEREGGVELAIAEYIAGVWRELGFNASVVSAQGRAYSDDIFDVNYDAMLFDYQATGVNAWSVLAPFAMAFSGSAKVYNPAGGFYEDAPFVTGFQDSAYDALIEEIMLIDDKAERHEKLKQAERIITDLAPIAPLYFNSSVNITEEITGISYSRFGFPIFNRANLRNHQIYTTTDEPREFLE